MTRYPLSGDSGSGSSSGQNKEALPLWLLRGLPFLQPNPSLPRVSLRNLNKLALSNPSPPVLTLPGEPNPDPNPSSWLPAAGLRIGIAKAGQFEFSKPKTLFSNIPHSREGRLGKMKSLNLFSISKSQSRPGVSKKPTSTFLVSRAAIRPQPWEPLTFASFSRNDPKSDPKTLQIIRRSFKNAQIRFPVGSCRERAKF